MVRYDDKSNDDLFSNKQLHRYLTMKEAAALLKVCHKTIHRWDSAGKITCIRTPGNHRRIPMSEVVRLQAQRNIRLTPNLPSKPPRTSPLEVTSSNEQPPWRHDMRALKAQLKILHCMLVNSFNSNARITVLTGLMEMIKEIMISIEAFRPLQSECLQLWQRIMSGLKTMKDHEIEMHSTYTPLENPRKPPKKISPPKSFLKARENARDVFFRLIKASIDSRVDPEEQERVHAIIEGILTPYQRLTEYLVNYQEGTLEYDVTRLLLTSHPSDHGIMRNKWSVRTLARACQQLDTKSASKSQVGRFYKEIKWHRKIKEDLKSPDPLFGAKMKAIGTALTSLKDDDILLYGDEFKFTSSKVAQYLKQNHGPEGLQYRLKERFGAWYHPVCKIQVTGVFDPIHHRLETIEIPDLTFESVAKGLSELCRRFLSEITGRIILIIDNATDHSPELLKPYLHEQFGDRVLLFYLPTYSPNSNPIEGIWKILLMSIVRQCSTREELRFAFSQALMAFQEMNSKKQEEEPVLHCPICHDRLLISKNHRKSSIDAVNKHICFNIPDLTPYVVDVLTHSLEVFF